MPVDTLETIDVVPQTDRRIHSTTPGSYHMYNTHTHTHTHRKTADPHPPTPLDPPPHLLYFPRTAHTDARSTEMVKILRSDDRGRNAGTSWSRCRRQCSLSTVEMILTTKGRRRGKKKGKTRVGESG